RLFLGALHSGHRRTHRDRDRRCDLPVDPARYHRLVAGAGAIHEEAGGIGRLNQRRPGMPFTLPSLPYPYDALEPHIDARTMEIHHTKHHQAYVNNLNAAVDKAPELAGKSLDDLMRGINNVAESVRTAVRNNGGGHWNHSMFWVLMSPKGGGEP